MTWIMVAKIAVLMVIAAYLVRNVAMAIIGATHLYDLADRGMIIEDEVFTGFSRDALLALIVIASAVGATAFMIALSKMAG